MRIVREPVRRLLSSRLSRNSLFAVGQALVVTACTFLAYRLVVGSVGLERFGVWSLLLAGTAFARIGDLSGGAALSRFVAIGKHETSISDVHETIHTVILTGFAFNSILGLAFWIAAPLVLPSIVAPAFVADALVLLPYAVFSMVAGSVAAAVASAIDGLNRADIRSMVVIAAALIFLAANLVLVPSYGVIGFGVAQAIQQIAMMSIGWLVLRAHIEGIGWLPYRWNRRIFSTTTAYTLKLNANALMTLLFEPLAKVAFNHSGGPGMVALFDFSSRTITQIRSLIIAAAMPLVPVFAIGGKQDAGFSSTLRKATALSIWAGLCVALLSVAAAPVVSLIILNRLDENLLQMNAILTFGWAFNTFVIPFYLAAQARGILRWNFLSHLLIALSVGVGVGAVIPIFGPESLVVAIACGLLISTISTFLLNAAALSVPEILPSLRKQFAVASGAITALCILSWVAARQVGVH